MGLSRAGLKFAFASWRVRLQSKRHLSAMVRVRNEEEFLFAAVSSVADHVSEIIIIDNLSQDGTPDVIAALQNEYPAKITVHTYPFAVRKVGREHWDLASQPTRRPSPHLSSTYYNWSLQRCRHPFILKWDGDMIARPEFESALEEWRASPRPVLVFSGQNVHPDRRHLVRPRVTDRAELLARLSVPGLPMWVTTLTEDAKEPRLFPRFGAHYDDAIRWTQRLASPFEHRDVRQRARITARSPCFLHMKFCKRDALANYSDDLRAVIADNIAEGDPLDPGALAVLREHGVASARLLPG
ncbi:MAG TPA: glycosyltransferase [Gemmatimonadaceae bacterium]